MATHRNLKSAKWSQTDGYIRLDKLSLEEVLPILAKNTRLKVRGVWINAGSSRLQVFAKKGIACVACGLKITHFWIERHKNEAENQWHLNPYATDLLGNERLMTRDHIIRKRNGGSDDVDNQQPMCCSCNSLRG